MDNINQEIQKSPSKFQNDEPKWDYTDRKQTLYTGAAVVGLNLLVILAVVLDRTLPAFHSFITGKP